MRSSISIIIIISSSSSSGMIIILILVLQRRHRCEFCSCHGASHITFDAGFRLLREKKEKKVLCSKPYFLHITIDSGFNLFQKNKNPFYVVHHTCTSPPSSLPNITINVPYSDFLHPGESCGRKHPVPIIFQIAPRVVKSWKPETAKDKGQEGGVGRRGEWGGIKINRRGVFEGEEAKT